MSAPHQPLWTIRLCSVTAGPGRGPMAGRRSRALEPGGSEGFLRAGAQRFLQPEPGTVLEIKAGRLDSGSKPRMERSVSLLPGHLREKQGSKWPCSQPVPPPSEVWPFPPSLFSKMARKPGVGYQSIKESRQVNTSEVFYINSES